MFKKIKEWFETKKAAVVANVTDDKGEMYVPTIVMVAGAVMLGFVLINIFDVGIYGKVAGILPIGMMIAYMILAILGAAGVGEGMYGATDVGNTFLPAITTTSLGVLTSAIAVVVVTLVTTREKPSEIFDFQA